MSVRQSSFLKIMESRKIWEKGLLGTMDGQHTVVDRGLMQLIVVKIKTQKGKGSPYSIIELRVPELIPVLDSQPAGDVSHKPGA